MVFHIQLLKLTFVLAKEVPNSSNRLSRSLMTPADGSSSVEKCNYSARAVKNKSLLPSKSVTKREDALRKRIFMPTVPQSPALLTKLKSRKTSLLSSEEQELVKIKEQGPFKARPPPTEVIMSIRQSFLVYSFLDT